MKKMSDKSEFDIRAVTEEYEPERMPMGDHQRIRSTDAVASSDDRLVRIDMPRHVIDRVRNMIPSAPNKHIAVMAYLYITMGRPPEFPEEVKAVASQYEDDGGMSDLQGQVLDLTEQLDATKSELRAVNKSLSELGMALLWLVGEKMGYNVNVTATSDQMEFMFPELAAMRQRLVAQATAMRNQEAAARGREINAPRYRPPGQK